MSTHGRNAITLLNGEHICYEQSMDGHTAAADIINDAISGPSLTTPTMENQTDECGQVFNFGHIDYRRRIIYSGLAFSIFPELLNGDQRDKEYSRQVLEGVKRLQDNGWKFIWDCNKCPKESNCINSIPVGISQFLTNTSRYKWESFLHENGRGEMGGISIRLPGSMQYQIPVDFEIRQPRAIMHLSQNFSKIYAQITVGRKLLRSDATIRNLERQALHDPQAKAILNQIAPPIWEIVPVHTYVAKQISLGNLELEAIWRMGVINDVEGFRQLIADFVAARQTEAD